MAVIMNVKDAVSASLAECYVTIEGKRYNFMQAINLEAKMEKTKKTVLFWAKTGKGNRSSGWKGTGSATFHYNNSVFQRDFIYILKKKGRICILICRLQMMTPQAA